MPSPPRAALRARVVLVDDDPQFLRALERFLAGQPRFNVVGCARSGEAAIAMAADLLPDILLVDVQMPGLNGFQTVRRLKRIVPDSRAVLMSNVEEIHHQASSALAGADGFLPKRRMPEDLLPLLNRLVA